MNPPQARTMPPKWQINPFQLHMQNPWRTNSIWNSSWITTEMQQDIPVVLKFWNFIAVPQDFPQNFYFHWNILPNFHCPWNVSMEIQWIVNNSTIILEKIIIVITLSHDYKTCSWRQLYISLLISDRYNAQLHVCSSVNWPLL